MRQLHMHVHLETGLEHKVVSISESANTLGRQQEIENMHRLHYVSVVRTALWITGDRSEAEELAQEAFIRLAESFDQIEDAERVAAYLHRIVVNLSRSRIRRLAVGRQKLRTVAQRNVDHVAADAANDQLLDSEFGTELRKLPKRQLQCIILRYQADLSVPEIAEALGIAEGSVKSHLHRGVQKLKVQLTGGALDVST